MHWKRTTAPDGIPGSPGPPGTAGHTARRTAAEPRPARVRVALELARGRLRHRPTVAQLRTMARSAASRRRATGSTRRSTGCPSRCPPTSRTAASACASPTRAGSWSRCPTAGASRSELSRDRPGATPLAGTEPRTPTAWCRCAGCTIAPTTPAGSTCCHTSSRAGGRRSRTPSAHLGLISAYRRLTGGRCRDAVILPGAAGRVPGDSRGRTLPPWPDTWLKIRVELLGGGGIECDPPPGRDFIVGPGHSFAQFADGDRRRVRALGPLAPARLRARRRHDRSATRTRTSRPTSSGSTTSRSRSRARSSRATSFEYVFDFGDHWRHRCTRRRRKVDPVDEYGHVPPRPVVTWGWGWIPDQYGRRRP